MSDNTDNSNSCQAWDLPTFESTKALSKTMLSAINTASVNQDKIIEENRTRGYEAGYNEGLQSAKQEMQNIVQVLNEGIKQINALNCHLTEELEAKLLDFCVEITKQAMKVEIVHSKEYLVKWVKQGVESLSIESSNIEFRIHPQLLEKINLLNLNLDSDVKIDFKPEPNLEIGEINVISGKSHVDLSINNLVDSICRDIK